MSFWMGNHWLIRGTTFFRSQHRQQWPEKNHPLASLEVPDPVYLVYLQITSVLGQKETWASTIDAATVAQLTAQSGNTSFVCLWHSSSHNHWLMFKLKTIKPMFSLHVDRINWHNWLYMLPYCNHQSLPPCWHCNALKYCPPFPSKRTWFFTPGTQYPVDRVTHMLRLW
jgi:hypothetical protein